MSQLGFRFATARGQGLEIAQADWPIAEGWERPIA
jgi:hypothetical protein